MATKIFVNLPVEDLGRSMRFFEQLGYRFNPQFTDETAACMVISEDIYAMLLTHEKFRTFTPHPICDARTSTEVLIALTLDSRAAVDDIVGKAVAAGGSLYNDPQDYGFMYSHGFKDPDGHIWEVLYMNPEHVQQS